MADRIQQRRDTAARWAQYNPILLEGEVGYVTDDPNQYKIGDGVHTWNELPLRGYTGTIVQKMGNNENAVMSQKAVTDLLNSGYLFKGIATPDTDPGTPDGKVFYIAYNGGEYVNFNLTLNYGYLYFIGNELGIWKELSKIPFNNLYRYISSIKLLSPSLNDIEQRFVNSLIKLDITGYDKELSCSINTDSSGNITNFLLNNSEDNLFLYVRNFTDNGNGLLYGYNSISFRNTIIRVSVLINTENLKSFSYGYDSAVNKNVKFISTKLKDDEMTEEAQMFDAISQKSIAYLSADNFNMPLVTNTMYFKFYVSEPVVLGSLILRVKEVPNNEVNWVEAGIYPMDNGLGTALRITKTLKHEITKTGIIRLPFEHKVLQPNVYALGIKTNCTSAFFTASGVQAWRGYDGGNTLPSYALHLVYPFSDKYPIYPAFSIIERSENIGIIYPPEWEVVYEPQYSFIGQNDEKTVNYYIYGEDGSGGEKLRKFYSSTDGGLTKNPMHSNFLDWETYHQWGEPHTAVVTYDGSNATIYYNTTNGYVVKCRIENHNAVLTNITPPNKSSSISEYPVASYAPLVLWKNYLWWGEYQDPATPRIHKMNISTEQWYISVEKSLSGKNGARHCHFIYKSPVDTNVLWAVWGDASNGAGQGINRLYAETIDTGIDAWEQWTTGLEDTDGTTLPYPTAILETYQDGIIGAGDQPPTHLITCRTRGGVAGKYLIEPLNFKMEIAPNTETCHWLAMDDDKTIYYMTVESRPYMSIYASPYPYVSTFRISKYWQQALAGNIGYSNGYVQTRNYRFPKLKFANILDVKNVSKVPYVDQATQENIVDKFNQLLKMLQGSNILQVAGERGNDINTQNWSNAENPFENWG